MKRANKNVYPPYLVGSHPGAPEIAAPMVWKSSMTVLLEGESLRNHSAKSSFEIGFMLTPWMSRDVSETMALVTSAHVTSGCPGVCRCTYSRNWPSVCTSAICTKRRIALSRSTCVSLPLPPASKKSYMNCELTSLDEDCVCVWRASTATAVCSTLRLTVPEHLISRASNSAADIASLFVLITFITNRTSSGVSITSAPFFAPFWRRRASKVAVTTSSSISCRCVGMQWRAASRIATSIGSATDGEVGSNFCAACAADDRCNAIIAVAPVATRTTPTFEPIPQAACHFVCDVVA
mmetsp:Transcript_15413/g.24618  ORF Transcript_15413/g.24618 Transcript_15413/m.24618 type:complete len:294 (-) Transcript_15413:140-1021(-)